MRSSCKKPLSVTKKPILPDILNLTKKPNNMKTYTFIEEHDLLLNETFYFTRQDGLIVTGTMGKDYDKAYLVYQNLSLGKPMSEEKVLFTVTTP
jgi:hypothetical protein